MGVVEPTYVSDKQIISNFGSVIYPLKRNNL